MHKDYETLLESYEELEKQYKDLAQEKSRAEIVSEFLKGFTDLSGIEKIVETIVFTIMDAIGGANVILYYEHDEKWFFCDVYNPLTPLEELTDPDVLSVIKSRKFLETDSSESYMYRIEDTLYKPKKTWIFPMVFQGQLVGVIKVEGVFLNYSKDIRSELGLIINYLALILRNELFASSKIMVLNKSLVAEQKLLRQEIEKRIQVEKDLQEKEEYLRSIYEVSTNIGIILTDLAGEDSKILDMSPGAEVVFDCTKEMALNKPVSLFHTPESVTEFPDLQTQLREQGKTETVETTLVTYTGHEFPALFTVFPKYNRAGEVVGTIGITIDISQQKKEEERYRRTIENSFDGFLIIDNKARIVEVNDAYCKMTGFSRKEFLQMTIDDIEVIRSKEDIFQVLTEVKKTGHLHFETKHVTSDNRILDVEVNSTFSPETSQYYVFLKDVTAQKRMISEQQRLREQNILMQKQESIGRLAGGVAHDLNNLLVPILGYSELLSMDLELGTEIQEQIQGIYKAGVRAKDLVGQLLAYSRKQIITSTQFNLNTIIRDFLPLMRRTIRENIIIDEHLAGSLPDVYGDKGMIEQILMNLTINAKDAIAAEGIISIETGTKELFSTQKFSFDVPHVFFSITDTGAGMDEDILSNVYEPFFTTKGQQGSGLGLSTVFGIVKQHNGFINIESETGAGTTVTVYLPIYHGSERKIKEKTISGAHESQFLNKLVLVIEDDPNVRLLAISILEKLGFSVISAESGEQVLHDIDFYCKNVDLILTDIILHGINGRDLYKAVSKTKPDIPVIYMSGYTDDIISDQSSLHSQEMFIQKPFTIQDLEMAITKTFHAKSPVDSEGLKT